MRRPELHLPLCCTLIGGLWTICWAMVYHQCESDRTRVSLEQSVPFMPIGLGAGFCTGHLLQWLIGVWPPLARFLAPALVATLVGSIAGPFGWLARDSPLDWSGAEAIRIAAGWGAGIGLVLFALGRPADRSPTSAAT